MLLHGAPKDERKGPVCNIQMICWNNLEVKIDFISYLCKILISCLTLKLFLVLVLEHNSRLTLIFFLQYSLFDPIFSLFLLGAHERCSSETFPPDGGEDGVDEVEDSGDVGKHLTETQKKTTTFKDFNQKDIKM